MSVRPRPFAPVLSLCLAVWFLLLAPVPALAGKWGPHVDLTGKLGNERSLFDADLFVPVMQDQDSLLFLDLRFQVDDDEAGEGNFGLGYRQLLDGWIAGGYAFFDVRESQYDNKFQQLTLGAEALTENYDARVNLYLADEDKETLENIPGSPAQFGYSGNTIVYTTSAGILHYEKSLSGFDAEIGGRLPGLNYPEVRGYIGGYYFDASEVDEIAGPRARVEVRFPDIFGVAGSFFELGAEVTDDSERDTDYYLTARLRIPFGGADTTPISQLTPLEKRMTERVQRDPDIIVADQRETSGSTSQGVVTSGGTPVTVAHVNSSGATGSGTVEDPYGSLTAAAGTGADIVLLKADSVFTGEGIVLANGQKLLGEYAGMTNTIPTDLGDIALPAPAGTAKPVIGGPVATAVRAAGNTEIAGLILANTGNGLLIDGTSGNVNVHNVAINSGTRGIQIQNGATGALDLTNVSINTSQQAIFGSGADMDIAIRGTSTLTSQSNYVLDFVSDTGSIYLAPTAAINASGAGSGPIFGACQGTYRFDGAVTAAGPDEYGLYINGSVGADFDFNNLAITNPATSPAIYVNSNDAATTIDIAGTSSISVATNNPVMGVYNGDQSTVTFGAGTTVTATAASTNGRLEFSNADGTYNFNGQLNLLGREGVIINNGSAGQLTFLAATIAPEQKGFEIGSSSMDIAFGGTSSLYVDNNYALDVGNDSGSFYLGPNATITATGNTGTEKIYYGGSSGTYTFDGAVNFYDGDMAGLYITTSSGATFTFADLAITDMDGSAVYLRANDAATSIAINGPSAITQGRNAATLTVDTGDLSTLTFANTTTLTATNGTGLQFNNADGNYNFNGAVSLNGTANNADTGVDVINGSAGTFTFAGGLDIVNPVGHGLYVNNPAPAGTVRVLGGGNSIAATGGSALFVLNAAADLTFDTLASTNGGAGSLGVNLTGVSGAGAGGNALSVTGATTVTNAGVNGINLNTLTAGTTVTFNEVTVNGTGQNGIELRSNGAGSLVTFNGPVDINAVAFDGLLLANNAGNAVLQDALDISNSGEYGIYRFSSPGSLSLNGTTTVTNSGQFGVGITFSGATTFNQLVVSNTGTAAIAQANRQGVFLNRNTGLTTIGGGTINGTPAGQDGINAGNSSLSLSNMTVGGTGAIGGNGISFLSSGLVTPVNLSLINNSSTATGFGYSLVRTAGTFNLLDNTTPLGATVADVLSGDGNAGTVSSAGIINIIQNF